MFTRVPEYSASAQNVLVEIVAWWAVIGAAFIYWSNRVSSLLFVRIPGFSLLFVG